MISEKRNVIVAPFPRTMNEIFSERDLKRLASFANVFWAEDRELPDAVLENLLPETWAFVGFSPPMTTERLRQSPQLKAILEVGGHFPPTIEYSECFARGVTIMTQRSSAWSTERSRSTAAISTPIGPRANTWRSLADPKARCALSAPG
jgi:hypothetical protein